MAGLFKALLRMAISAGIGMTIALVAAQNVQQMYSLPTQEQITDLSNNADTLVIKNQQEIIERSRSSALRILSLSAETGMVASSSGTYIKMYNSFYVITTNHGILGSCEHLQILADNESYDCIRIVEQNTEADYALIEIEEINNRQAVKVPQQVARTNKEWKNALAIMSRTIYTGFPNGLGPLTIDGKIMGHSPDGFIYMNSYAWSGSSGSGVFSQSGEYIGYVLAIDVGPGFNGPAIIEDVVLVVPAYKINWASARQNSQNTLEQEQQSTYNNNNNNICEETGHAQQ